MSQPAATLSPAPKPKPLRAAMPLVSAFIDDLRSAFGTQGIDAAIKSGLQGLPTFHAREGGQEVGTRPTAVREFGYGAYFDAIGWPDGEGKVSKGAKP